MDFVRWGMAGAQPRFQVRTDGDKPRAPVMVPLGRLPNTEDRQSFAGIPHPDARHIAAASPDIVLQLVAAARERDVLRAEVERAAVRLIRTICC